MSVNHVFMAYLFLIIFLIIFSARNFLEYILVPRASKVDKGLLSLLLFVLLYFTAAIAVAVSLYYNPVKSLFFYILGTILFSVVFIFRIVLIKRMNKTYNQFITPTEESILQTKGWFSIVRHPLYFLYFIEMCGLLLIQFNYISLIAVMVDMLVTLLRIRKEERMLLEKYGKAYEDYQQKVKMIIPFVC